MNLLASVTVGGDMNNTLLGIAAAVVMLGATAANAQDCGPMPQYAPQGQTFQSGRYELRTTQQWVQGNAYQVWVNGTCDYDRGGRGRGRWGRGGGRGGWQQRCSQGYYRTEYTAGHYETRQQWVWVGYGNGYHQAQPPPPQQYYPYGF